MSFNHGKQAVFKVDDSGGVLRDISTYINSVDMPKSADTAETSTFGSASKSYVPGLKDAQINIEGLWDPTVDGYLDGIVGKAASFEYGPAGSAGGSIKYSGECICTSYNPPTNLSDAAKFSASFQVTGDVTRGTF